MINDPFYEREAQKYDSPIASRELILDYLTKEAKPANLEKIAQAVSIKTEEQKEALHRRLRAMERDGQVVFTRRKCYALPEKLDMVKGKVIAHRDGFGFLRVEGKPEDYFLSPEQMKKVLQGDVILAQPLSNQYRGKTEARVVRILEPRSNLIVGRYFIEQGVGFVVPDDSRLNFDILITGKPKRTVRMGTVVVVELQQRPERRQKAVGVIKEVLGEIMGTNLAIDIALRNHEIPYEFPKAVEKEVSKFGDEVPEKAKKGRKDLRDLPLVTIDGEDARDFDDAVYCQKNRGGGYRLWVAIADVSYYVRPDKALDKEACLRGTSVYFPSRVVPMLPEALSNGLCSLNPQVDRLCLVCEMTVSNKGRLTGYQFYDAVMNSHARLTYTKVAKILDGDKELRQHYHDLVPHLENLYGLYKILDKSRIARGAIGFESEEPKFIFNADKRIESIELAQRNDAHKIIEECMILANVAAAKLVIEADVPALFRVHDRPDEERMNNLRSILQELGLSLGGGVNPKSKYIAELMLAIEERIDSDMLQTVILRSMKQAIYDPENRGHFGLALEEYGHFTSPIRRYPDLLLHRTIKWILANEQHKTSKTGGHRYTINEMLYFGEHCSLTERRADEAVRDVVDWLKCDYMQDHVGEVFNGTISSVVNFGFFVRLDDLFIDGLVHVSSLENDYYIYDASRNRLIGENTHYSYRLGDKVSVKVENVNPEERKIDFALVSSNNSPKRQGKTAKTKAKQLNDKNNNDIAPAKKRKSKKQVVSGNVRKKVKATNKNKGKRKKVDKNAVQIASTSTSKTTKSKKVKSKK
ncbi:MULTISPECIES: ribonuclease R [unclassified Gilliamella]|uniref:ribonuclease R n=1 Tax=unclassified Gilliamella TaxID=2685620 RepID=UPI00226998D2|nr:MULTISPECIES: ribonuclease R [unclassified Gilliamella]MCX8574673.1 ribonuclease R [Gilliamella sp. B3831]MCX8576973.1 ribonuclease R [Gilliamella sp. B3815]MCX8590397.1 ribonuclease R [Gilliamella sp. B3812]MCX8604005.1 ribonuclease R [Gilliamella sp. B3823]MCX8605736.1 ribonuclease R [Gilliamella sp. B3825]